MIRSKKIFRRSRIAGLFWFAGLFAFMWLYWWFMANVVIQDFRDPQYVMKYELLRARLAENPGRPLWLVIGTSRVERGLCPAIINDARAGPGSPLVYNFGLGGAGLFRDFICLHRVLEAGIRPRVVGIEVFGALLNGDLLDPTDAPGLLVRARKNEIADYMRDAGNPDFFLRTWRHSRWDPFDPNGMRMSGQTLSWRLLPLPGVRRLEKVPYDKWGWYPERPAPIPEASYQRGLAIAKAQLANRFIDFKISPRCDAPLRGMLDMCKNAGIPVFLLKMPEDADFRALYTPQADMEIQSYLAQIGKEYHVPLIDATFWFGKEAFTDGHHLNATGAEEFTRRLAGELSKLGSSPGLR